MSFVTNDLRFYTRAYIRARRAAWTYTDGLTSVFFNAQNSFTLQYPLLLAPLRREDDDDTVTRKMRLVAMFVEIMLARRIWNFQAISHSTMQYRAFLIMKAIRRTDLEALRANLIHRLSPEGADRDEYIDFQTQKDFSLHGNNGPKVHRLLAQSLHPIAYENKPGFRSFREATGLSFVAKETFKKADLDDRQALYIALANRCWSAKRLTEI